MVAAWTRRRGWGCDFELRREVAEGVSPEGLGQDISEHVRAGDMGHFDVSLLGVVR